MEGFSDSLTARLSENRAEPCVASRLAQKLQFGPPVYFGNGARVWFFRLENHGAVRTGLLPAQTRGAIPSVRGNVPRISNTRAIFEVNGGSKNWLLPRRPCLSALWFSDGLPPLAPDGMRLHTRFARSLRKPPIAGWLRDGV